MTYVLKISFGVYVHILSTEVNTVLLLTERLYKIYRDPSHGVGDLFSIRGTVGPGIELVKT